METPFTFNTKLELVENSSEAALGYNPLHTWAKFILTDDTPNLNGQRIPQSEFINLIRTGAFAPIKMASGKINPGHDEAIPLGVITNLKEEDNMIIGLAALWGREREADVNLLKTYKQEGKDLDLSWEIFYHDSEVDDNGVESLHGCILRAATLVGLPAYDGRTPILSVASLETSEEKNVEELDTLKTKIQELENLLAEKDSTITSLNEQISSLSIEKEELANFKADVEKQKVDLEKISAIKQKFIEAGITKEDSYFEANREKLLGMKEDDITFLLQEIISLVEAAKETLASSDKNLPNFKNENSGKLTPRQLGKALRESK